MELLVEDGVNLCFFYYDDCILCWLGGDEYFWYFYFRFVYCRWFDCGIYWFLYVFFIIISGRYLVRSKIIGFKVV